MAPCYAPGAMTGIFQAPSLQKKPIPICPCNPTFSVTVCIDRYVECEPDVSRIRALPEDRFIVMASDGLWDVIEDRESVAIVQVGQGLEKQLQDTNSNPLLNLSPKFPSASQCRACALKMASLNTWTDCLTTPVQEHLANVDCKSATKATLDALAKDAAELLLQKATHKKSMDNVTALVLLLQWH